MHNAAFGWCGLSACYQARRVTPAELPAALAALRAPEVLGANLSLPHKEAALAQLDTLSVAARAIGAVNTVVQRGGLLHGENTDAPGLLRALDEAGALDGAGVLGAAGGTDPGAGVALVLGAGGAARAAVWALRSRGQEVWVLNRTPARAATLCRELGGAALPFGPQDLLAPLPGGSDRGPAALWAGHDPRRVTLLVNASSGGLGDPDATPLPVLPPLAPGALVYDMVYQPATTRLMRDAGAAGYRAANGLGMLAHQARLAFLLWTGQAVPAEVFLDALHAGPPRSAPAPQPAGDSQQPASTQRSPSPWDGER